MDQIKRRIDMIEKFENEIKTAKELLKTSLENNPAYIEATEATKEALSKKRIVKENILNSNENQKITRDIKDNLEEINTLKDILSTELMQLYQESNTDEIEDLSGQSRKFKIIAKLLPKKGSFPKRNDV